MSFKKFYEIYRAVQTTEGKDIVSPLSFFDACINPSTHEHNKNFVNKKLEIITKRLTRELMIRTTRFSGSSSLSAFLFYLLPEKLQYYNIIVYFILLIYLFHFCWLVTWEKKHSKKKNWSVYCYLWTINGNIHPASI